MLVYAAGWLFVQYTPVGGDDNHVLSIGIGGGLEIVMMFNVWGSIWLEQQTHRSRDSGRDAPGECGGASAVVLRARSCGGSSALGKFHTDSSMRRELLGAKKKGAGKLAPPLS